MKRIHWATLAVAALLPMIHPPGAPGQPLGAGVVSGLASVVLDDGVERTIALSAETQRDGTAAGSIEFNDPARWRTRTSMGPETPHWPNRSRG